MIRLPTILAAIACAPLGACVSMSEAIGLDGGDAQTPAASTEPVVAEVAAPAPDRPPEIGRIAEASWPRGKCGMMLWTIEDAQPALVFRSVAGEGAIMNLDGAPTPLAVVAFDGPSLYGVSAQEDYRALNGVEVDVDVSFGLGFDGGSYVERGTLTVAAPNGWRKVAPVAGLAGCRAAL